MAKSNTSIPSEKLELYNKLIASMPDEEIEIKGKTMPYTSLNGHMFSFLTPEGKMGLRLSKEDCAEFIEKYKTKLMEQHGTVLKEYVEVPFDLLSNTKIISDYLKKSVDNISRLKPKPTKK